MSKHRKGLFNAHPVRFYLPDIFGHKRGWKPGTKLQKNELHQLDERTKLIKKELHVS